MPKRTKTVFSNHAACMHMWASQSQDYGRSGPCYFQGASAFSYGSHFELGRIVTYRGVRVAILNAASYSNTTAKHKGAARRAVSHLPTLYSNGITTVPAALKYMRDALVADVEGTLKRRKFWSPDAFGGDFGFDARIAEHNALCARLGVKRSQVKIAPKLRRQINEHVAKCHAKQSVRDAAAAERRAAKAAEVAVKATAELQAWLSGGPRTSLVTRLHPQRIRVRAGIVETSGGAEVPLKEAARFLRRILAGEAVAGDKVGSFEFNRVEDGFAIIGCHDINIDEARRVLDGGLSLVSGGKQ